MLSLLSFLMLAAWWFVDVLIDLLEHRRGPSGSWLAGAAFMALLCFSASADMFKIAVVVIAIGLAYNAIYWLRIRRY